MPPNNRTASFPAAAAGTYGGQAWSVPESCIALPLTPDAKADEIGPEDLLDLDDRESNISIQARRTTMARIGRWTTVSTTNIPVAASTASL